MFYDISTINNRLLLIVYYLSMQNLIIDDFRAFKNFNFSAKAVKSWKFFFMKGMNLNFELHFWLSFVFFKNSERNISVLLF